VAKYYTLEEQIISTLSGFDLKAHLLSPCFVFNRATGFWFFQKFNGSGKQEDQLFYSLLTSGLLLPLPLSYLLFLHFLSS
jgi:hypothetical protein